MSFSQFPKTISVCGLEIPIETDFRSSIAFELLVSDPDASQKEMVYGLFDCYFPRYAGKFHSVRSDDDPELVFLASHAEEAIKAVLGFYSGGMPEKKGASKKAMRLYDFSVDEPYIYASFLQAYEIDLREATLHWWDFKALLSALPQETIFEKILQIRGAEISSKLPKEEKERLHRLKRFYALPTRKSAKAQEIESRTMEILMGSGNLSELR